VHDVPLHDQLFLVNSEGSSHQITHAMIELTWPFTNLAPGCWQCSLHIVSDHQWEGGGSQARRQGDETGKEDPWCEYETGSWNRTWSSLDHHHQRSHGNHGPFLLQPSG
jgi:hypothetical protein